MANGYNAEERNQRCRPPDSVSFPGVIVTEVFEEDNHSELQRGLEDLFGDRLFGSRADRVDQITERPSLHRRGGANFPHIADSKFEGHLIPVDQVFTDLGDYIDFLRIETFQILPSTQVMTIIIYLSQAAQEDFSEVFSETHEEMVVENRKKEEISAIINKAVDQAVDYLEGYFSGKFFQKRREESEFKIPALPVFSVPEFPQDNDDLKEWIEQNHSFLRCLDMSSVPRNIYRKQGYLLSIDTGFSDRYHRFAILANEEQISDGLNNDEDRREGDTEGIPHFDEMQRDILHLLAFDPQRLFRLFGLLRYSEVFEEEIVEYKRSLVSSIDKSLRKKPLQLFSATKTKRKHFTTKLAFEKFKEEFRDVSGWTAGFEQLESGDSCFENTKSFIQKRNNAQEKILQIVDKQVDDLISLYEVYATVLLMLVIATASVAALLTSLGLI